MPTPRVVSKGDGSVMPRRQPRPLSRWPPPRTSRYDLTSTSRHDVMTGITPDVTPDTTRTQQLPSQHSPTPDWPSLTLGPAGVTSQAGREDSRDRPADMPMRQSPNI
ncbi:hypothetical protein DAPPUDRAFT_253907 [Daphnia pulex]|uniref:Uncharacterized protein n=1 Tax=Daphnia pulex TaxID=6669 RepID=E9H5X3_DAPPU|nr:hypothetical protein DAPPUDRAFT_253907 [Daphnia pulex]|eukprot:EFX72861.1 hypothetical protein DAPPUDRAFT_253907 [Daphnia pulex]